MNQKTITNQCSISGYGIHTGKKVNLELYPAKENTGIVFQRIDLKDKPSVRALFKNVASTNRSTNIKDKNAEVQTIEHLMAAIFTLGIDNLLIKIDNVEVPILDGSSKKFTEILRNSSIKEQSSIKKSIRITKKHVIKIDENESYYQIEPSENFSVEVKLDYDARFLKNQIAVLEDINKFEDQISSARTFSFLNEVDYLIKNNLIKGGNLDNSVIIVNENANEDVKKYLIDKFGKENLSFEIGKLLNKKKLRFDNEPARHKLLDFIGDLSLIGSNIKGKITCFKPGHKSNYEFVKKLDKIMSEENRKIAPKIDFSEKPYYDINDIKKILPHREPFIFIDEIRDLGEDFIVGVKYVKEDEDYFRGHFPAEPVMPGVLQLETMAQAGGVLILTTVENPQDYLTFFMKIDNAKFKKKVTPGDTIIFRLNLISPIRRGLCHMHGKGFVNGEIVVEADLLAQIAKKN
jgi:UDP-3-O-[3-hydroxymyristoyl] N-acetylglucosamine deacetylase/3-hydroxyacyl-[acyl-carrier-protein] dehydratase